MGQNAIEMNVNVFPDEWQNAKRLPFGDVRRLLEDATLPEQNAILGFVRSNMNRIRPAVDDDWLYGAMSHYLLLCITRQTESETDVGLVHTPFEAAHELVQWFNWIVTRDDDPTAKQNRSEQIAVVYKNACGSVRNCIETGFLEHALEIPSNRPYFANWNDDEILAEGYAEALRWGEAHTKPNAP